MDAYSIIEKLARAKTLEAFVESEAVRGGVPVGSDRADISQLGYMKLLKMNAAEVERLEATGELNSYARKIIRNLMVMRNEDYFRQYSNYSRRAVDLSAAFHDEDD